MFKKAVYILVFSLILTMTFSLQFSGMSSAEELVIDTYMSDPAPKEAMEKMVDIYQEKNPDLDIELNITSHEDFKEQVRTLLMAKDGPDVITWFAGERAEYFVEKGLVKDITHIWEEENLYDKYSESYQDESVFDGKAYFLPHQSYGWSVFYNQEIFDEYGLKEPEIWDEFIEVCDTLKENDITPFTIGTRFEWTAAGWFDHLNIRINGFDFHKKVTAGEVKFTDDRIVKVFEKWKELIEKDYFIEDPASYTWQEALEFMEKEEAAMYLMGSFIHDSATDELSEKLDFFRFPAIEKSPTAVEAPIDGYMIPANANNIEAAEDFLKFAASVEGQQHWVEDVGRVAPNENVPEDSYDEETKKEMKMINEAEGIAQFLDRDMEEDFAITMMSYLIEFWENPDNYMDVLERLEAERASHYE